jgi:hypothetical protein
MDEEKPDLRVLVQAVVEEYLKAAPAHQAELEEEKKKRESLEQRVNELVAENQEAKRSVAIRTELQRLGVVKLDLAYRAVKEETPQGGAEMNEYLARFVGENPELLPARVAGGSGAGTGQRPGIGPAGIDLEKIRPGMNAEELERIRQEVARVASLTLRGY